MEMHVLLADRDDEMARRRECAQVAAIVIDPRKNRCAWIAGPADRIQKGAIFLVVASSAAHASPGEIYGMDRGIGRNFRPAAGAAGIAEALFIVFGMIPEQRGQL